MVIRPGCEDDIPWLMVQCHAFADWYPSAIRLFPDDWEHAIEVLGTLIDDHLLLIAELEPGTSAGFIAGMYSQHFMNPAITVLSEVFWWVEPQYRYSKAGLALLEAYTAQGKDSADWVTMSVEAHTAIKPGSLEKRGYRLNESSYLMET